MAKSKLANLLFAQGGRCFFCDEALPQGEASVEHLVAVSKGGTDHEENCVVCCERLNKLFGDKSVKEKLRILLAQRGEFRCPAGVERERVAEVAEPVDLEEFRERLVQNLARRGAALPGTVKALTSSATVLFKGELEAGDVERLVQLLVAEKLITVEENKLIYSGAIWTGAGKGSGVAGI